MSDENMCFDEVVVRVEALTYSGKILSKDGVVIDDMLGNVDAEWKFYAVLAGPQEIVKRCMLDSPYKLRVVVRPPRTQHGISYRLRGASKEAKALSGREWFGGTAFDGARKVPNDLGINVPMSFVEQWRNC